MGEFAPNKTDKGATFYIEGQDPNDHKYSEIHVDHDCKCCCGKLMEIID